MPERLIPGAPAPDFTLKNSAGEDVSLRDFRGRSTVIYFYPAASTPGCTKQACDFRDSLASLKRAGFDVVGISPDAVGKLAKFAEAYAAWGEKKNYGRSYEGLIRSTIVVDPRARSPRRSTTSGPPAMSQSSAGTCR